MKVKKPNGYDEATTWSDSMKLPPGGYVVEIKKAILGTYSDGTEYMQISFDICEGDYAGYFTQQYKNSTFEDKKYKGRMRITLAKGDGTDRDRNTLRTFKTNIVAIESSNEGYKWNWDTDSLIGLKAGLLFRNKEYNFNGNHGFWTEPIRFYNIEKIRNGEFEIPKDKMLEVEESTAADTPDEVPGFSAVNFDDVPF